METVDTDIAGPKLISFEHSESTEKLDTALARAQGEIQTAAKDALNPHFNAAYADLASVWDACRKPLSTNGISVTQWPVKTTRTSVQLLTRIAHAGQWMQSVMEMPVDKPTAQGVGSAITYARRYMLSSVAGVAPDDDDDGNAASGPQKPRPAAKPGNKGAAPKPAEQPPEPGSDFNDFDQSPPPTPLQALINFANDRKLAAADVSTAIKRVTGKECKSTELSNDELVRVVEFMRMTK